MVTQLQPDVRAYLHGGEVIKRYIRVEEVAHEYGFSVEETEYIAKAAGSLYKLTRIHLVKKERFDEFMKHIYKVPGTNKQIIKKFARIGEASIIYSIGRHRSGHIYVHYRYDCKHEARQNCRKCFTNSSTPIYSSQHKEQRQKL